MLSFVRGAVVKRRAPAGDGVVFAVGTLLRELHDAQAGFEPPADAQWQLAPVPPVEVVCHNDALGTNYVFRAGRPVALIDWELAAPGPRIADVAAAAAWWVPLRPDEQAHTRGLPSDRRLERLRAIADGYGLDDDRRAGLLDATVELLERWYETYRVFGGVARRRPWAERWDAGRGASIRANIGWLERHRRELERWLD